MSIIIEKLEIDRPFLGLAPFLQQSIIGLIIIGISLYLLNGFFGVICLIVGLFLVVDVILDKFGIDWF